MEDFLGLIILIIYFFAAASSKKKKAKKKKQTVQRRNRRKAAFEQAFGEASAPAASDVDDRMETPYQHETVHCEERRIHLHDVAQEAFAQSGEGEDPCHAGGAPEDVPDDAFWIEEERDAQRAFAQDVLRGVVMSEILTRPCDRAPLQKNRRRAV